VEAYRQYKEDGRITNQGKVWAQAGVGAISGLVSASAGPQAGLLTVMGLGAGTATASGVAGRLIASGGASAGTVGDAVQDAVVGGVTAGLGYGAAKAVPVVARSLGRGGASATRPATQQPRGGNGRVLRDGEGATPQEIAASTGGATGGSRRGQAAVRQGLINQNVAASPGQRPTYFCWRCGQATENPSNVHLGHRNVPTSRGGNLAPENVCLEGAACNISAGNRGAPSPGMSCAERGGCGTPYGRTD
jgi:hypothetical protein